MELRFEGNEKRMTVQVVGTLDGSTSRMLVDCVTELANGGRNRIRLDLGATTLLDTSGIGALTSLQAHLRGRGGDLTLVNPSPEVQYMFGQLGMTAWLTEGEFHPQTDSPARHEIPTERPPPSESATEPPRGEASPHPSEAEASPSPSPPPPASPRRPIPHDPTPAESTS